MLLIKRKLVRCIDQNETRSDIGRDNTAADNRVIFFTTTIKLPCGLKQFEKLAGRGPMLRIRRNADHVRFAITSVSLITRIVHFSLDGSQTSLDDFQAESEAAFPC